MSAKTHNNVRAIDAKAKIRQSVLAELGTAHVLDVFCGPVGEMYRLAWKAAGSYTGIDKEWSRSDTRRRFVGDAYRVLRAISLAPFNVFDVDAFGSPWEALDIIGSRRPWAAGEMGAIVVTDGSDLNTRFGSMSKGLVKALGKATATAGRGEHHKEIFMAAIAGWLKKRGLRPRRAWYTKARGQGSPFMYYAGVVFEALGDEG